MLKALRKELREDIEILQSIARSGGDMPKSSLVRATLSPILRKWISDRGMKPIHDEIQAMTVFPAFDHQPSIQACKDGRLAEWTALLPAGSLLVGMSTPPSGGQVPLDIGSSTLVRLDYNSFCSQKMAYYKGNWVTRAECIRFVADRMGGTHTQLQAIPRKNDPLQFIELIVFRSNQQGSQIEIGDWIDLEPTYSDNAVTFPFLHLVLLDTARRFVEGVRLNRDLDL